MSSVPEFIKVASDEPEQHSSRKKLAKSRKPAKHLASVADEAVWTSIFGGKSTALDRPAMLQLHEEILEFCEFMSPTVNEDHAAETVCALVESAVHDLWPSAEVILFGSRQSGVNLPDADLDFVILRCPMRSGRNRLYQLADVCGGFDAAVHS